MCTSSYELISELHKKLKASSVSQRSVRKTMDITGVVPDFQAVTSAIKHLSRPAFRVLKQFTLQDIMVNRAAIKADGTDEQCNHEILKFADAVGVLSLKCVGKLKVLQELTLEQIAIYGVLNDFFEDDREMDMIKKITQSVVAKEEMKDYTPKKGEMSDSKDFYGVLCPVVETYFSSASILPYSVSGNTVRILMTLADKYEIWSDGDENSPFNYPKHDGKRLLRFL
jgi:hypothetical protein